MRSVNPSRFISSLVAGFFALAALLPFTGVSNEAEAWEGKTIVVPLDDTDLLDGRRSRELVRLVEKVNKEKVGVLVLELDTSTAVPWDSQLRFLNAIQKADVKTVAWVKDSAIGPGALLALACDEIYLTSSGIIGAAGLPAPDSEASAEEKANWSRDRSVSKAKARSLASLQKHNPKVAEAFVDENVEVKFGDRILSKKGDVLTLTADEAVEQIDGGKVIAEGIADTSGALMKALEAGGEKPIRLTLREFGENENRAKLSEVKAKAKESTDAERKEAAARESDEEKKAPLFGKREEASYEGKVVVLKVGDDTLSSGKASFDYMDRILKKAELDGAEAVIFDMDTPGGYAWYTEGLVLNSLQDLSYPTYTFVNSRAESAGAIIAMGTDAIYMRPAATIGSALVVGGAGQDLSESMRDKVTQMMIGTVRNVAELKGHNPDVAEAFVTREKEVKIDGIVVHEAGNVLNLNTIRATEEIGGKPVLAKGVASKIEQIVEQEELQGELIVAEPYGLDAFAQWVQRLSFVLIIIGVAGAYLELNSPGFGIPGLVSVCALSLFFFGNYMAGNLAGYELAVLLVIGLVLVAVEIFVFPGTIIPGAVGAALVLVSLGLAMVDRVELEWKWEGLPGAGSWGSIFSSAFLSLVVGMAGALAVILLGMRFLPQSRFGSRLILEGAVPSGASISMRGEEARTGESKEEKPDYVGRKGETTTDLVPSGKGLFEGQLLDIVSDGEFIKKGEAVRVTHHEGSRIVVSREASA